jgi:hypothetical protein
MARWRLCCQHSHCERFLSSPELGTFAICHVLQQRDQLLYLTPKIDPFLRENGKSRGFAELATVRH